VITVTRVIRRAWQIYVAYVFLFMVYLVEVGYFGQKFGGMQQIRAFNVEIFLEHPAEVLFRGLILMFKPVNMDVLPLYIVLILASPIMLFGLLHSRNLTLLASFMVYFAARHFGWNFPSYPGGGWFFNPLAWQLLYVSGAWFAVGGAQDTMLFIRSRALLVLGTAYLVFALVMTMAGRFSEFGEMFPSWLVSMFNPNDKTNLALYRYLHFLVVAFFVVRFLPRDWPGLQLRIFRPAILCGQQSLETFCAGIFLAFAAHIVMVEVSEAIWMQIILAVVGIVIMTLIAWYRHWSNMVDKLPKPASKTHSV